MALFSGTLQPSHPNVRCVVEPRYLEIHEQELQHHPMRTYHPLQPVLLTQPSPLLRHDGPLYETIPVDFGSCGVCELKVYRVRSVSQGTVPAIVWCSEGEFLVTSPLSMMVGLIVIGGNMMPGDIDGESSVLSRLCHGAYP